MTNSEIAAGAAALETYAEGQSWKARFAPAKTWHEGSIDIIRAADGSPDRTPAGQVVAGINALHVALKAIDQETALSVQQYHDAAAVVLAAVNKLRPTVAKPS
jgi:hypothetical protein